MVERVAARTPIRVEARLVEAHLVSEGAMALSRHDWSWVGPLTASRQTYWEHLSRTTAFLATAWEESYGLEYVEALVAVLCQQVSSSLDQRTLKPALAATVSEARLLVSIRARTCRKPAARAASVSPISAAVASPRPR